MKRQIRVLPPEVVDQIAAGEVVERPASVIKELVENALDAGATEIWVQASGGGITLMEVSDNGMGMDLDEAKMAVRRHATSKIQTLQDLESLTSLGFRGEALSSIASVCRLEILSRIRDSLEGARVGLEAGKTVEEGPWGCPAGTSVRVEDLFFNVPARRKFLRSEATEARHMKETLERMALVEPEVGFHYDYEGRRTFDLPATSHWQERVRQIWGKEVFQNLHPIDLSREGLAIEGFLSHPNFHRSTASWIWFYVNGRAIQDRGLLHAIMRGYGPLMEKGRYPIGVLQIKIHPQDVDVNVHPTKREVRFRRSERVYDGVVAAVRRLLREQPWTPHLGEGELPDTIVQQPAPRAGRVGEVISPFQWGRSSPSVARTHVLEDVLTLQKEYPSAQGIRFLGQVGETYLVFSSSTGLLIIDQHAAHERLVFERLREQWGAKGQTQGQGLLWAEVVELTQEQGAILIRLREIMASLGWNIEPFGGDAWRIRTIPSWMDPGEASDILRDLLDACLDSGMEGIGDDMVHKVLARLACRGAVKGGHRMGETEALDLLKRMRQSPAMGLCPHGRPTVVEIPLAELRRRFERS